MSPTSLLESRHETSDRQLHPKLKAVLASLDVQIEEELTRYRRHRRRTQRTGEGLPKKPQSLEAIAPTKEEKPKTENLGESEERSPLILDPSPAGSLTVGEKNSQEEGEGVAIGKTENPKGLNDYLESSERLLKSLDKPAEPKSKQRNVAVSIFTPVGVLSMLLFTLSCTTLGYAFIYAKNHNYLGLGELLDGETTQTTQTTEIASGEAQNMENLETAKVGETGERKLPESPLNSSQDFVELDLDNLGSINPKPTPIASLNLAPSIPPPISGTIKLPGGTNSGANGGGLNDLGTTLLPPATTQPNGNQPQLNPPPPQRPQPTPAKVQTPIQSPDGWFYVVKEYAGENSLEQAREIVPDAYIRQTGDGPKIQMGALMDAESAKRLLEELEEQGLSAQYYEF